MRKRNLTGGKGKEQKLLTPRETSSMLGVAEQTLAHWRARGYGPRCLVLSARCVRYEADELQDWLRSRRQASTAENSQG